MVAIITRAPAGFPGLITRDDSKTIVPYVIDSGTPPTAFGGVVKIVSEKLQPFASGDGASVITGFLVKAFPVQSTTNTLGAATPPTSGIIDVLKRGYIATTLAHGTAAKNGQVYVRTTAKTNYAVGDIEAAAEPVVTTAAGTNTGTGTIGTTSATAAAMAGAWTVTFTAATAFTVTDPNGDAMKAGATGSAYTAGGLTFTITAGGTAFIAGDSFTVTVAQKTVAVPNAFFTGPADANSVVEIAYNI